MHVTQTNKLCADMLAEHNPVNKTLCRSAFGYTDPATYIILLPKPIRLRANTPTDTNPR